MRSTAAAHLGEGRSAQEKEIDPPRPPYTARHAAFDLAKLRGKALVERIDKTRRYGSTPWASALWPAC